VQGPATQIRQELGALRSLAGALSIGAGFLHLLYAPVHFEGASEVGFFFVIVGVDQIAAGLLLLLGISTLPLMLATLGGTLAVIVIYIATRTTGLPLGPTAGQTEPLGFFDGLITALEALVVLVLCYLLGAARIRGSTELDAPSTDTPDRAPASRPATSRPR